MVDPLPPTDQDPRALAFLMLQQGRSLAEIRNALSARGVELEVIDEISDELADLLTERDAAQLDHARQNVRTGTMMIVAAVVIAGVMAIADLPSRVLYIIPGLAVLLGVVRVAGGVARIRSERGDVTPAK